MKSYNYQPDSNPTAARIKKGDTVKVIAGNFKGKVGKVMSVNASKGTVIVDALPSTKRHIKPSQLNPRGGTKEIEKSISISNVQLVVDEAKGTTSRIGYTIDKDGKKTRVSKVTKKEIK
ncbi:50S ribosomal protein L24 [Candidatus Saccharibacteria bacterium 32-45-3]|nr:MAG: 50S ribosomal protein L24 [Candidatus Saccharibacteria bacterium 32-45-3]